MYINAIVLFRWHMPVSPVMASSIAALYLFPAAPERASFTSVGHHLSWRGHRSTPGREAQGNYVARLLLFCIPRYVLCQFRPLNKGLHQISPFLR